MNFTTGFQFLPTLRWDRRAGGGLELGISLPPGQLGSGKVVSLEDGLGEKQNVLVCFKMATFPLPLL